MIRSVHDFHFQPLSVVVLFVGLCQTATCEAAPHYRGTACRSTHSNFFGRRCSGGRPKPVAARDELLRLYTIFGSYGATERAFNRLYAHAGVSICRSTVRNWVKKYAAEAQAVRRRTRNLFLDSAPANLRWCIDGTGKADATGKEHFILVAIDFGSRFCPLMTVLAQATADAILQKIRGAFAQFCRPDIIRTDNASVFRSEVFQKGSAAAGIRHEFTAPGKPWQNGRVERIILTLKEKLNLITPENAAALNLLLTDFTFWYNTIRGHQHLHGWTPLEAWRGVDPYRVAPKAAHPFAAWGGLLRGFYLLR